MYVNDQICKQIAAVAYPDYHGRKISVNVTDSLDCCSYWDGGTKSYFVFLRLADMQTVEVPEQGPGSRPVNGLDRVRLPQGIVAVEHLYFCGTDAGITIHAAPDTVNPLMLPLPTADLTIAERIVLCATRSYKNSYMGESNCRLHEAMRYTGIDRTTWESATATLIGRKLLTRAGAITLAGRNAVEHEYLERLRMTPVAA